MANPAKLIFGCLFGKRPRVNESFRTNEINKPETYWKHAGGQV